MRRAFAVPALMLAAPSAFFAAFFLAPLVVVLIASFTGVPHPKSLNFTYYVQILADRYHWNVIIVTFRIAILTTLCCTLLGYPVAWYLVRLVHWRLWRRLCVVLVVVPLVTSNIVRAFGWMVLLGRNGLVNRELMDAGLTVHPLRFLGTELGILIGMVYVLLPFSILTIGNALARVDAACEEASADLGARPVATFWHVIFPLTLPGVAAGGIIVFTLSVSAYVTPALLSDGRISVLSMLIFQQYSSTFNVHYGGALSIVLLAFTLIMVALANRVSERRGSPI